MDTYIPVAMCSVSAYICVYVVPVKCEKYSLKCERLGENWLFFHLFPYNFSLLYIYDITNGRVYMCCNV